MNMHMKFKIPRSRCFIKKRGVFISYLWKVRDQVAHLSVSVEKPWTHHDRDELQLCARYAELSGGLILQQPPDN